MSPLHYSDVVDLICLHATLVKTADKQFYSTLMNQHLTSIQSLSRHNALSEIKSSATVPKQLPFSMDFNRNGCRGRGFAEDGWVGWIYAYPLHQCMLSDECLLLTIRGLGFGTIIQ